MSRFCPNCSKKLHVYNHYFCGYCGFELPEGLVQADVLLKFKSKEVEKPADVPSAGLSVVSLPQEPLLKKFITTNKKYLLVLGVVFIATIAFGTLTPFVANFFNTRFAKNTQTEKTLVTETAQTTSSKSLGISLGLKSGQFITENLANYVPADIDLYIETADLEGAVKLLNIDMQMDFSKLNTNGGFFVEYNNGNPLWYLVMIQKTAEDLDASKLKKVGNALIYSNSEDVTKIQNTYDGIARNLLLNPQYALVKNNLDNSGSVKVLILSSNGRGILSKYAGDSGKFNEEIEKLLGSGKSGFVLN